MALVLKVTCIYWALILQEDEVTLTEEKMKAAGISINPFWPGLFAKPLANVNIGNLIYNTDEVCSEPAPAAGAAPAGGPAPSGPAAPAEKKAEAKKEESDDDMGFVLFD